MSRKFDRKHQINLQVQHILESPLMMHHIAGQIFRPRPIFVPKLVWRILLWLVLAPRMRERPKQAAPQTP